MKGQPMPRRIIRTIVRCLKAEDGPTAVEYAVMLALIIVVCIAAVTTVGTRARTSFTTTGNALPAAS
jgi:pilus assembly protein Flp/PilA